MDSDAEDTQAMANLETAMAEPAQSAKKSKHKKKNNKPAQVTIQVLQDRPERAPPIVGYFPSGFDPTNGVSDRPIGARVFRHKDKPKRLQIVVSPSYSKVDFVGTNYSGEAEAGQQHCNYAIGVLDKETQTLKIVPIASNKIFRLEPKIRGLEMPQKEPGSSEVGESSVQNRLEKLNKLNVSYGTKKSIRRANKLKELGKEDDPETKKDMDEKIKQIGVKKEALESTQVHVTRNIPPYNVAATSHQEAYPLDKIILTGEWSFLEDIYQNLNVEAKASWEAYPSFIVNRMKKLQDIEDEEERKRMAGIFSFITHLVKFKDLHSMDGVSSAKRHKFPSILHQRFSRMFSYIESKTLSSEQNDLLISYVLVLTLFADEFDTSLTDIAKDLRMTLPTVRTHYENLGCKLIRRNNLWFATLPVPLEFPKLRQKRRRKD